MKILKTVFAALLALTLVISLSAAVFADGASSAPENTVAAPESAQSAEVSENSVRNSKAIAAAVIISIAAAAGAVGMALTIMKTIDGMARQPEASGNMRGAMMLGLVFIETAIIYALIVAILVVFVL